MAGLGGIQAVLGRLFKRLPANAVSPGDQRNVSVQGAAENHQIITGDTVRVDVSGGQAQGVVGARIVHIGTQIFNNRTKETQAGAAAAALHQLPADVADFAGRAAQVEELLGVLSAPGGPRRVAISAIDGMGGLGKTTLAVHVAHRLTGRYADGQIVVDMAGTSAAPLAAAQGLARVIRAFQPVMQLPEAATELRPIYLSLLHGRRVLVILDNAVDGDQVAPLVPPADCALIVTARRRIAVAGAVRVDLDLLAPAEATGLLRAIIGDGRADPAQCSRIAELCGFLPLALRVAGMFLVASPHWTAAAYIAALADERQRLALLHLEGSAALDVAASLALSVAELRRTRPDIADRWHELAVFPTGFDTAAASAVWQQPAAQARTALERISMKLTQRVGWAKRSVPTAASSAWARREERAFAHPTDDSSPSKSALGVLLSRSMVLYDPGQQRWRLHDLMRDLAGGGAAAVALGAPAGLADRLAAARGRHAEHFASVLAATSGLYLRGGEHVLSALGLFDRERRNIETGQAWAAGCAADDPAAARLCVSYPDAGVYVLFLRQHPRQRIAWLEAAAAAAREIGDRRGEGAALGNLGLAYAALGDTRRAIELYEQQIVIAREIGDRRGEGNALNNLGVAYAALGDTRRAIELYEQVLVIAREIGDRRGEGNALGSLGLAYAALGETRRAIEYYERRLVIAREIGDRRGEGNALNNLGVAYAALGDTRRAIELYEQQLVIAREIGDRRGEGATLGNLGLAYAELGETRRAIEYHEQALSISRAIGDRRAEGQDLGNLGVAYAALGETRRAIELYEQVLVIAREIGDRRGEGIALYNLGNAYAALGDTRRAIASLGGALSIFEAIESPYAAQVRAAIAMLQKEGS